MRVRGDRRGLTTMLFTDIVGSSEIAVELGDRRWRRLQARHHSVVRRELHRHNGREVDTAGDGFFATFATPASGARCAFAILMGLREMGLEVRAGLHIGETELAGEKVGGIAVSTAARVAAAAGPGQVLVTETIVQLVAGSGLEFSEIGVRELKGVPGRWELFKLDVVDGDTIGSLLDPEEARERRLRASPENARPIRKLLVAGLAAVVALVAGIVLLAGSRGGSPVPSTAAGQPAFGPVEVLSAASPARVLFRPAVATLPSEVGASKGAFGSSGPIILTPPQPDSPQSFAWIMSGISGQMLQQVDQSDGAITNTFRSPSGCDATPGCLAEQGGKVWVMADGTGARSTNLVVARGIDLKSGKPGEQIPVLQGSVSDIRGLVSGGGSLWIGDGRDGNVYRLDPVTGQVTRYAVDGALSDITFGGGYVWVLDALDGTLTRLDPATRKTSQIALSGGLSSLTFGGGHVWITDQADDKVWMLSTDMTGPPTAISVGKEPIGIAYGDGAVWVANFGDDSISRIDPAGAKPEVSYPVEIHPRALAAGDGRVWVVGYLP